MLPFNLQLEKRLVQGKKNQQKSTQKKSEQQQIYTAKPLIFQTEEFLSEIVN